MEKEKIFLSPVARRPINGYIPLPIKAPAQVEPLGFNNLEFNLKCIKGDDIQWR